MVCETTEEEEEDEAEGSQGLDDDDVEGDNVKFNPPR